MSDFGTVEFSPRSGLWKGSYSFYTAWSTCENRIRAWLMNLELGEQGLHATECERNAHQQFPHEVTDRIVVARDPNFTAKKRAGQLRPAGFDQEPQNEGVLLTRDQALDWLTDENKGQIE